MAFVTFYFESSSILQYYRYGLVASIHVRTYCGYVHTTKYLLLFCQAPADDGSGLPISGGRPDGSLPWLQFLFGRRDRLLVLHQVGGG